VDHPKKLLFSAEQIDHRIKELGAAITSDYKDKDLVVIGILKGSFIFTADLVRHIELPLTIDFIRVASYGDSTDSSDACMLTKDAEADVAGRNILLVEDIVDSGRTLTFLRRHLKKKGAASISCCVLIDKQERRQEDHAIEYLGFQVQKGFLVGYGLDWAERYRNLPAVYTLVQ
jgi:hypoxanthine phosphoribosyltransferase